MSYRNKNDELYIDNLTELNPSGSFLGKYYSPSFIKTWNECPAKLAFNLIEPETPTEALIIGTQVHRLMELKYTTGVNSDYLLKIKKDVGDEIYNKTTDYVKVYDEITPYTNLDEAEFYVEQAMVDTVTPLNTKLPAPLKGVVDRVDIVNGEISIVDYKTSSKRPSVKNYLDQMIVYKWLIENKYGTKVKNLFIASLYPKDPKYIRIQPNLKDESMLIDKIYKTHEEVTSCNGHYKKAKGCFACRFCNHKDRCFNEER